MWQPSNVSSRHESRGEDAGTSSGTKPANTSANVKGSWVDLGAATGFAYEAFTVCVHSEGDASPVVADFMLDLGISDGSNRAIIVADLHCAFAKAIREQGLQIYIPVHVPAGAQLSARVASSVAAEALALVVIGHASGLGGAPGFSRCVALFTPRSSRGINVDPGGSANTKSGWTEITSSCPENIGAMFGLVGYDGDVSRAASASMLIDIGIGAASSEFVLYPNASIHWGAVKDGPSNCPRIPVFACNVPKTTRIAARAQCLHATDSDRDIDLALYGLVP